MYIFKVLNTIYIEIKHKLSKKKSLDKINCTKMSSLFFCKLHLITVLLLICDSCMSWSTRSFSLKLCVGFSSFSFISFLLKFIFLFNKMHGLFDLEKPHTVAPRPLNFKLQQEVLKFNNICMSCSSTKTDLVTSFSNLENWSFENVNFS